MHPPFARIGGLLALLVCSVAATKVGQLYAYSRHTRGLPLYYCDGQALIGLEVPSSCETAYNVTFTLNSDSRMVATPTNLTVSNTTTSYLTVQDGEDQWEPAMFISPNTTVSSTQQDNQFVVFASSIALNNSLGQLRSTWYAVNTTEDGVYRLSWNQANNRLNDTSFVVALRNVAPVGTGSTSDA